MLNCATNNKTCRSHCNGNCGMMNQKKKAVREKSYRPTNGGIECLEIFFLGKLIRSFACSFTINECTWRYLSTLHWRNETLDMHILIVLCNKSQTHEKDSSQHLKFSTDYIFSVQISIWIFLPNPRFYWIVISQSRSRSVRFLCSLETCKCAIKLVALLLPSNWVWRGFFTFP